jgi:hypothetical protein
MLDGFLVENMIKLGLLVLLSFSLGFPRFFFQRSKILTKKNNGSFTWMRGNRTVESLNGMFTFRMASIRFFYYFPILIKLVSLKLGWRQ